MTAAPYTRATIARIRDLARCAAAATIAAELGWSPTRLADVARTHGIELADGIESPPPSAPPGRKLEDTGLTWDRHAGVLSGRGLRLVLPLRQAELFDALCATLASGEPVALRERFPLASQVMPALAPKLKDFDLFIEARTGRGGGCRLVHAAGGQASPASADPDSSAIRSPAVQAIDARYPRNSQGEM